MNNATGTSYQMQHGQQVKLERDKNELVLKVGIAETGIRIPKDGVLVLDGNPTRIPISSLIAQRGFQAR